jgi:hypothetical protein
VPSNSVCIGENLTVSESGLLQMAPWSTPQLLADVMALSSADGNLVETIFEPGNLMIDQQLTWINNTPVNYTVLIRVTRRYKQWIVSNPNAIEFRDRWNWAINAAVAEPTTSGLFNGQCGSAEDLGTNTVAMPNSGLFYHWWGTTSTDEWVYVPVNGTEASANTPAGDTFNFWYQVYVWTPPPWSDNGNLNSPQYVADAGWSRIQLIGFPQQGALVSGAGLSSGSQLGTPGGYAGPNFSTGGIQ